jgi:undecaprenyl-diphosphatase
VTGATAHLILRLPPLAVLLAAFALPALESSAFIGFVFPGEIALLLGGALASQGVVTVWAVLLAGVLGAVLGDTVGYAVGHRYGRGLLDGTVGRWVRGGRVDRAEAYLARRGASAVFFGRFTAALRVVVPGLAGMAGVPYRRFLVFNVAGALGWVALSVALGYVGGASWQHTERLASVLGLAAAAVLLVVLAGPPMLRRHRAWVRRVLAGLPKREVTTFLAVGGSGYVVDVAVFNLLRATPTFAATDPAVARTVAVAAAMCVTYLGNRTWTWPARSGADRRREIALFVSFNMIGFAFSVGALLVSHDLLGLTSRLADNVSANVVGLALGTAFRFVTYRLFVFTDTAPAPEAPPRADVSMRG